MFTHTTLCFQGARAQRVEYLLLHAFHAKKFMVPDKFYSHPKETKSTKRKLNGLKDKGSDETVADDATFENEPPPDVQEKTKKGPAYAGGLVLEPKRGLYDKYILLLDFNSLYPSIIQVNHISSVAGKSKYVSSILRPQLTNFLLNHS